MNQQSTAHLANTLNPQSEPVLLAETIPIADLTGFFQKTLYVGPHETGALVSGGNVLREMYEGPHKVGWSFLGWGTGKKQAVRMIKTPFRLQLLFSDLLAKGYESLDCMIYVTVSIASPNHFYSSVVRGRESVSSVEVASSVSVSVDDLIQVKVTQNHGQALLHDNSVQSQIIEDLEPQLTRALEERGLALDSIDLVAFNNPHESGELLDGLSEVDRLISEGVKPGREDVQGLLNRLRDTGLATKEMSERAQLLFDGGTDKAFFSVMNDISVSATRRLEAQLMDKTERLSEKVGSDDTPTATAGGGLTIDKVLGFFVPVAALAGIIYGLIPDTDGGVFGLAAGLAVAGVLLAGYIIVRAKRLLNRPKKDEIVIRLDKWVKRSSMKTDDLIRRQMGREFTNALENVKNAKLLAYQQEKKILTDALSDIENRMDLIRSDVESAPAASTIVSVKNFPSQRIYRMVKFEEELLRQSRDLSIRSNAMKESLNDDAVNELRLGLDEFHSKFTKRIGLLEGFKDL